MNVGLYNNSLSLWQTSRPHYAAADAQLHCIEGHIVVTGEGVAARFENQQAAIDCLIQAGYRMIQNTSGVAIFSAE